MKSLGRIHRVAFLVFALLVFCAATGWSQGYERKVEVSWDFSTATTTLGWTPERSEFEFGLTNGALMYHPGTEPLSRDLPARTIFDASRSVIDMDKFLGDVKAAYEKVRPLCRGGFRGHGRVPPRTPEPWTRGEPVPAQYLIDSLNVVRADALMAVGYEPHSISETICFRSSFVSHLEFETLSYLKSGGSCTPASRRFPFQKEYSGSMTK
jgi:hypothetical protein